MNQIHLPIMGQQAMEDIEAELARFEAEERARLGLEAGPGANAGAEGSTKFWRDEMLDATFTRAERARITLLIGGLPAAQDFLIPAALKPLGYSVVPLPQPDLNSLKYGKEFGNRAQCNPTYFTVGNLVKYLCELRDSQGLSAREVVENYVFLTAGSCGPCRFGQYTTEYRKALRDAGFEGFRVVFFQEKGGMDQVSGEDAGLELTPPFFLALGRAVLTGDVLNGLGYRVRPYELEPGRTDAVIEQAKARAYATLERGRPVLPVLDWARRELRKIPVDRTRIKARVGLTGEFWAMMNDGAGSYHLQKFLESEGAEVKIQFVADWMLYNVWEEWRDLELRVNLRQIDAHSPRGEHHVGPYAVARRRVELALLDQVLRRSFDLFANVGGYFGHKTQNVEEARLLTEPLMSSENRGGEGFNEVAHNIVNFRDKKANMTLSVKPFGCLPSSSISDGVQSKVSELYPGAIFCAVETSGDGAVNFYSRVQLFLFKAQQAAQREFDQALADTGLSAEQVRDYAARHPRYFHALHVPPRSGKAACTAANHVYDVHAHMQSSALGRAASVALRQLDTAAGALRQAARRAPEGLRTGGIVAGELLRLASEQARARLVSARA